MKLLFEKEKRLTQKQRKFKLKLFSELQLQKREQLYLIRWVEDWKDVYNNHRKSLEVKNEIIR